jgi:hypothetical protein
MFAPAASHYLLLPCIEVPSMPRHLGACVLCSARRQLVFDCRFLFPFEVRRRYFYSTAFGLGRALQHLQVSAAALPRRTCW